MPEKIWKGTGNVMAKKMAPSGNMPQTVQDKVRQPGSDLGSTNAYPRSTEFDLKCGEHVKSDDDGMFNSNWRQDWCPNEQTFTATKRGNRVTAGRNY